MTASRRSLGPTIRAARLGWRWSERHGAFIRMSTEGTDIMIELAPADAIPRKNPNKYYRCWWEQGSGLLDMIPWLKGIRRVKKYIAVNVNDLGEIVK